MSLLPHEEPVCPDAAIEGVVEPRTRLKEAIAEVYEDTAGYSGSDHWRHFYLVVYQCQPFETAPAARGG